MQVKRENLKGSRVKLEIIVPMSDLEIFFSSALEKLKGQTNIKGFRPGKAPDEMAKEQIGEQRIASEALDNALPQTFTDAVKREKVVPLHQPKVSIKQFDKKKDLIYTAEVAIVPKVTLPEYKKIKIKIKKVKVEKQELENSLSDLRRRMASFEDKLKGAEKGDLVEIEFEGKIRGARHDKLSSKNHPLILGETQLIPGFLKKLLGMKKGEEKKFKLSLPKEHPDKDLAGEGVDFEVKVLQVKKRILPEIDNKLAEKLGSKNVVDLKNKFKEATLKQKEQAEEKRAELEMVRKIAGKVKVDLPKVLIDQELERIVSDMTAKVQAQGVSFDKYLESIKKTRKDLHKELWGQAEENVRVGLTIAEIGRKEKIEIEELEVENERKRMINEATAMGAKKEDLEKAYSSEQGKRYIENILSNRKTIEKLKQG